MAGKKSGSNIPRQLNFALGWVKNEGLLSKPKIGLALHTTYSVIFL